MLQPLLLALVLGGPPGGFAAVRVLATADLHGRLAPSADFAAPGLPRRELGGWDGLARAIERERTAGSLLLDCGDFAFGSPEANASHGRSQVRFMNHVGYDAAALGARDFNEGTRELELLAGLAAFPLLADPLLDVVLNRRVPLFRPWCVRRAAGVKVGLVGLSDPRAARYGGAGGFDPGDPLDQCRRYLRALAPESCDVIVVFGHFPSADGTRLLDSVPKVDLVLCPDDGGEPREKMALVAAYGHRLAVVDLLYDRSARRVDEMRSRHLNVLPGSPSDSPCSTLVREFLVPGMDSVVARASVEMAPAPAGPRDACAGQVVAGAVRAAVGSHISLVPTSAIESGLAGPALTRRELHDCVPHRERLLLAVLDDTGLHKLLAGIPADEPFPYLAGADLFVLGDTTNWPLASQVCRVRYRDGRNVHRVVAPQQLYRAAGIESSGNPVAANLTELWLESASALDTIRPAGWPKTFAPTAGLLPAPTSDSGPVNINTAGIEELQRLPGIGPATARRILAWREAHGLFGSVDELANVSGIGPAKLEKIRPLATVRD